MEPEEIAHWRPKLRLAKSQTSQKRRHLCLTKKDEAEGQYWRAIMDAIEIVLVMSIRNGIFGEDEEYFFEMYKKAFDNCFKCYHFLPELYNAPLKPHTLTKSCQTPEDTLHALGYHSHSEVRDKFGFTLPQLITLSQLLFESELDLRSQKRGAMPPFEATLLVCARLRFGLSKAVEIGRLFGRDPSAISAFVRLAIKTIVKRFGYTLMLENMARYSNHAAVWNQALNAKFEERFGGPLQNRFALINCFMDGYRMNIATPSVAKDIFFSEMLASQPNLLFLLVTGANGMVLGVSESMPGCEGDADAAFTSAVQTHLTAAGLFACCEATFPHTPNIKPLPKSDEMLTYSAEEKAVISHLRIGVEWCAGEIRQKFQYFQMSGRQKIWQTRPAACFRAAVVLQNCQTCFEGNNAISYFHNERPAIDSYLVPDPNGDDDDDDSSDDNNDQD